MTVPQFEPKVFVVAITKDKQPRSFRFQVRSGYSQAPAAISRAVADAAKARREAERIFGPLDWQDAKDLVIGQDYVVQVARVSATGLERDGP